MVSIIEGQYLFEGTFQPGTIIFVNVGTHKFLIYSHSVYWDWQSYQSLSQYQYHISWISYIKYYLIFLGILSVFLTYCKKGLAVGENFQKRNVWKGNDFVSTSARSS